MSVLTPNMSLIESTIGFDTGLSWEQNLNASLDIIDGHNHSAGSGVQINPDGININSDLPFGGNNATNVKTVRFSAQSGTITGASPNLGCIYVAGVDLYYNDESGNIIRLTNAGSIAGATGSISGLVAPASASFVSLSQTFIFQSAVNTPANIDVGSVILRDILANSKGITLSAPNALANDYTVTYPAATPQKRSVQNVSSAGDSLWASSYDAIVGSSAQVTAGSANYTSIQTAINAFPTGSILVLNGTYVENVTVAGSQSIMGEGSSSIISGTLTFSTAAYSNVKKISVTGNISMSSSSSGNILVESYVGASATVTDSGSGNYIQLIQG